MCSFFIFHSLSLNFPTGRLHANRVLKVSQFIRNLGRSNRGKIIFFSNFICVWNWVDLHDFQETNLCLKTLRMGVLHSLPLCSRGNGPGNDDPDQNNNSVQTVSGTLAEVTPTPTTTQPLSLNAPKATSTPRPLSPGEIFYQKIIRNVDLLSSSVSLLHAARI